MIVLGERLERERERQKDPDTAASIIFFFSLNSTKQEEERSKLWLIIHANKIGSYSDIYYYL